MSRRNRRTKTCEQIRNEQIPIILAELENDIQNFKITLKKRQSAAKFAKLVKATKTVYQKSHKENAELKKYIVNKKHMINNNKNYNSSNNNNSNTINNTKLKVTREKNRQMIP